MKSLSFHTTKAVVIAGLSLTAAAKLGAQSAPAVTLSSTNVSFNNQAVFTTSNPKTVQLTNSGNATLNISRIAASGDYAQTNTCGTSVAAGRKCQISITFTPTAGGTRTGSVSVADNAANSPQVVSLTGTGIPQVSVTPSSLTFPVGQTVGSTSAARSVTVKNNLSTTLLFSGMSTSGEFGTTAAGTCGSSLAAGSSCTIAVTFTPTALGARNGTLTINDNATSSPQIVSLSGTGVVNLTLSPTSLSLGNLMVSTTGAPQTATLTNSSTIAIPISSTSVSGDFSESDNCGNSLAATSGCTITVRFTPTATGTRTGNVTITDGASNSPQVLSLSGNGVAAPVTLSPGSLTFSKQFNNTTSAAKTVTMTNTGNGNLTGIAFSTTGDFAQTHTCGSTLASGSSCSISVTFTPTASGTRTGLLTITDSASTSPQTVTLSGVGQSTYLYITNYFGNTLSEYSMNLGTGALTPIGSAVTGTNPNTMSVDRSCTVAYVPNHNSNNVNGYSISATTGVLTEVPGSPFAAGTTASAAAVDQLSKFVYVSNIGDSTISGYSINSTNGALSALAGSPFAAGANSQHAVIDPSNRFLYVSNDSGSVSGFTFDSNTGALTQISGSPWPTGDLSRYVRADIAGKFLYVSNTGSGTVSIFSIDQTTGDLTEISGSPVSVVFNIYELQIEPLNKFAYLGSIGNGLYGFSINSTTGMLTPLPGFPVFPGNRGRIGIDPTGTFVYSANQNTNNIDAYRINPSTGALSPIAGSPFPAGSFPNSIGICSPDPTAVQ